MSTQKLPAGHAPVHPLGCPAAQVCASSGAGPPPLRCHAPGTGRGTGPGGHWDLGKACHCWKDKQACSLTGAPSVPFPNPQGFKQLSRGSQQHSRWPARLAAPRDSGHWDGLSLLCGTLGGPTYHAGTIQDGGGAPVLTAGLQMDSSHIAEQEPATRAQMAPPEVCRALAGLARPRWR